MAFIPTPRTCRTALVYNNGGQQVVQVFHFRDPTTEFDNTALDAVNAAMSNWWSTQLKTITTSAMSLVSITSASQESASAPVRTLSVVPPVAGTGAVPGTAANTAIVVTHRTGSRGRSYRGRTYYGPLSNSYFADQFSTSLTQITNILTAFTWLLTAANTAGKTIGVLSHFLNKVARINGVLTPTVAYTADTSFDSARRRLLGRGA